MNLGGFRLGENQQYWVWAWVMKTALFKGLRRGVRACENEKRVWQ
jgi:hypothetical protein